MKRYLITGASRGIGRAIAEKLAAPDVALLLHGRDTVALADVCKTVKPHCAGVVELIHDFAVTSGVSELIAAVGKDPLDLRRQYHRAILINAAFRSQDAAGIEHREYSLDRRENRLRQLERLLHEQVCA